MQKGEYNGENSEFNKFKRWSRENNYNCCISGVFDVCEKAIQSLYFDHIDELDSDGTQIKSPKEFLNLLEGNLNTGRGKAILILKNNETIEVPNRGIRIFPCRTIPRIGILLRDLEVAQNIRTQLLNQSLDLINILFQIYKMKV